MQQEMSESRTTISALKDELSQAQTAEVECHRLADRAAALEADMQLAEERSTEQRARLRASELKMAELEAALARRDREVEQAQGDRAAAEQAQVELKQRVATLESQLKLAEETRDAGDASRWSEASSLRAKLTQLTEQNERCGKEIGGITILLSFLFFVVVLLGRYPLLLLVLLSLSYNPYNSMSLYLCPLFPLISFSLFLSIPKSLREELKAQRSAAGQSTSLEQDLADAKELAQQYKQQLLAKDSEVC